jgi:hypothetical protein
VFLIGLTGGAVLRQWAVNDRTPTETNSPIEPAVEAVAAAPPTGPQAGSSSRDVPDGPTAPDQITSTSVTVPPTTAPPRFATVVAPDANKAPPATLEPSAPSTTTTSTTATTTTTSPPDTTTTTMGCEPSRCPDQPGDSSG